ncbi:unnamed protein product [Brassica oleracea]
MDRISQLPEALLLKILSFLPTTKDVVATRLLYDDRHQNIKKESFSRFVDRSLLLHEAPVLESLQFNLGEKSIDVDIGVWARTVARRHVRGDESVNRLLSNCPFLEDLFVNRCPDDNVTVFTVRVPSLKILYMRDHKDSYGGEAFGIWRR